MNKKKKQTEKDKEKIEWLKRRYAKWKEKQRLDELLIMEADIADVPDYLDFEKRC